MKNISIIIIILISFICTEELSSEQLLKIKEATEDVNKAPNFSLESMNDSVYVLEDLKGSVKKPSLAVRLWPVEPVPPSDPF